MGSSLVTVHDIVLTQSFTQLLLFKGVFFGFTARSSAERSVLQVDAWLRKHTAARRPATHLSSLCQVFHAANWRPATEEAHWGGQVACMFNFTRFCCIHKFV